MRYTTLERAMAAAGKGYAESNPDRLIEIVNAIRQELYSMYSSVSQFARVQECFEVQTFCVGCNDGGETYRGITLPRDYATVEAMWHDGRSVKLFDRWRAWQDGIPMPCECGLKKFDMGDSFPTERDIVGPSKLVFVANRTSDTMRRLTIRGMTVTGEAEETYELSDASQATKTVWVSIREIVKDETDGSVVLAQENGRKLSIFAPEETVPAYKRIKITGIPEGCQYVNIMAAREYMPLHDERDVVETGNLRVWELMARYLKLDRKDGRTREEILSAEKFKSDAKALLLGDASRQEGKSTRTDMKVLSPKFARYGLNRTGRRWRA